VGLSQLQDKVMGIELSGHNGNDQGISLFNFVKDSVAHEFGSFIHVCLVVELDRRKLHCTMPGRRMTISTPGMAAFDNFINLVQVGQVSRTQEGRLLPELPCQSFKRCVRSFSKSNQGGQCGELSFKRSVFFAMEKEV
jgi:hypothetical protein